MRRYYLCLVICLCIFIMMGCAGRDETEETNAGQQEQSNASFSLSGAFPLAEEQNPELYQNAKELFALRVQLLNELLSAGDLDLNHPMILGESEYYYPVRGRDSWAAYTDDLARVFARTYIDSVITPVYVEGDSPLFTEIDGTLYRQNADGWVFSMEGEIQLWGTEGQFYYLTGYMETGESPLLYIAHIQKAEEAPYGLLIYDEYSMNLNQ